MRPSNPLICRLLALAFLVSCFVCPAVPGYAQTPTPTPAPKKKPAPAKPAANAAPKKAAEPGVAAAPKGAPKDIRFTSKYTTGDQVTESVSYIKGTRERYELSDMILLRQHDLHRVVQISRGSKTYLVTPEDIPVAPAPVEPAAASKPPGVVLVATSIVDTGERKTAFGQEARHVKTMIDRQPQPGACDQSKQRIETDGWYIDAPKEAGLPPDNDGAGAAPTVCHDEIKTTQNGDPKVLGFSIGYTTAFLDAAGKPVSTAMEVTEFEVTTLDASLFDIPEGLTAAMNVQELSKAVSNANEAKLAAGETMPGVARDKKPGMVRIGVPEVANKTTQQQVDTRALRTRLVAALAEAKVDAVPMAAAPQAELEQRASELGVDYLLMAEITELKATKPGGFSKVLKTTAGDKDAGKDITEAKLSVQLVPPGGKPRLSTTTSGKAGGVGVKTGLGIAKVAGTMYLSMYMGGMMGSSMGAFNTMHMMNMGGMGMLGNPALMAGGMPGGSGLDRTAGAASFLMGQAMMGNARSSLSQEGPSFDASLGDALDDAAKDVVQTLKKPDPTKKK
jgi:hypothetical protein